jgi:hypothetical protein
MYTYNRDCKISNLIANRLMMFFYTVYVVINIFRFHDDKNKIVSSLLKGKND